MKSPPYVCSLVGDDGGGIHHRADDPREWQGGILLSEASRSFRFQASRRSNPATVPARPR